MQDLHESTSWVILKYNSHYGVHCIRGNAETKRTGHPDVTKKHTNEKEHMYAVDGANKSSQAPEYNRNSQRDKLPVVNSVRRVLHRY